MYYYHQFLSPSQFQADMMSDHNFNRRDILKKSATASALPMAMGVSSARPRTPNHDVEITGMTKTSPDAAKEDVQAITSHDGATALTSRIEDETGYEIDDGFAVGIDLETDKESLNSRNPRIIHLPLTPPGVDDVSTGELGKETATANPEFSIDNGGVLLALTVRAEGERKLATLMGLTREKSVNSSLLAKRKSLKVTTKAFGVEDGSATIHRTRTDAQPLKSDWQAKLRRNGSTARTEDTVFTCYACGTVVGLACAGAIKLSLSSCAWAAVTSGAFSPLAGGAVSAFCLYIVANAGTLSCSAGTAAICTSVTGDCNFLE